MTLGLPIVSPARIFFEHAESISPILRDVFFVQRSVVALAVLIEHGLVQRHVDIRNTMLGAEVFYVERNHALGFKLTGFGQLDAARPVNG